MLYQERKIEDGYHYTTEDVFGIIDLYSDTKLDKDTLDIFVVEILKISHPQGYINNVRFKYKGNDDWREDQQVD